MLEEARGHIGGSEYVENADCLVRSISEFVSCDFFVLFEGEVTGKPSGRRGADVLRTEAFEAFGGLNWIVIALPVRKVELNREGTFFGLLATSFSSR